MKHYVSAQGARIFKVYFKDPDEPRYRVVLATSIEKAISIAKDAHRGREVSLAAEEEDRGLFPRPTHPLLNAVLVELPLMGNTLEDLPG